MYQIYTTYLHTVQHVYPHKSYTPSDLPTPHFCKLFLGPLLHRPTHHSETHPWRLAKHVLSLRCKANHNLGPAPWRRHGGRWTNTSSPTKVGTFDLWWFSELLFGGICDRSVDEELIPSLGGLFWVRKLLQLGKIWQFVTVSQGFSSLRIKT